MPALYPDLEDRAAVVTGASSGIGLGIAKALLLQGMRVAVHYKRSRAAADSLCAEHPGRAFAIQADLGTEEGCVRLAHDAVGALGGAQVLVHSAGIWNDGPIATLSRPVLEEMFRVNTFSAFSLVRELLPALKARGGSVVFIGSTAGQRAVSVVVRASSRAMSSRARAPRPASRLSHRSSSDRAGLAARVRASRAMPAVMSSPGCSMSPSV